jgi:rubrerythrin
MKKLIRQLKFAHAAEIAAYHAYEGHWRSVSNTAEREYIYKIALDELKHIKTIERILKGFNSRPSRLLDFGGKVVGELVGFACYYSGWRLPMLVAGAMEKIGTASYKEIALEAAEQGMPILTLILLDMAKVEDEHEAYFQAIMKR